MKSRCGKLEILLAFAADCGQTTAHPETIRTDARRASQTWGRPRDISGWSHHHSNACTSSLNRTDMDHSAQS